MTSDIDPVSGVKTDLTKAEALTTKEPSANDVSAFKTALTQANSETSKTQNSEDFEKSFSNWLFGQMRENMKEVEKKIKEDIDKQKEELES